MKALELVLVVTLTGCVSLTTGEENVVAELQDFANRTTALYRVPSVRISIQSATNLNTGAVYRQGNVFVNVKMLSSPYVKKLMAHESGPLPPWPRRLYPERRVAGRMAARPRTA